MANKVKMLIVHHSDSNFGDVPTIRQWHLARGWKDIGYNIVIYNGYESRTSKYEPLLDGKPVEGRGLNVNATIENYEIGAHTKGLNAETYGVCMIGKAKFTVNQFVTLIQICKLYLTLGVDEIVGHGEVASTGTVCPNFDMSQFRTLLTTSQSQVMAISMLMKDWICPPTKLHDEVLS